MFQKFIKCSICMMKLNIKFNKLSVELFSFDMTLEFKNSFNSDDICKFVKKNYPKIFTNQNIVILKYELIHYKFDVIHKFKVCTCWIMSIID